MLLKGPFPLKRRRHINWFLLLSRTFAVVWSISVYFTGQFREGKRGPIITPESNPDEYWGAVICAALIGLALVAAALIPFFRAFRDEKATTDKYVAYPLAGAGAGRTPEVVEMIQVGQGHKSGSAQLVGR